MKYLITFGGLIIMQKQFLIFSLCLGAMINTAQATIITSIKSADWGFLRGNYVDIKDRFQYCIGKTHCGITTDQNTIGDQFKNGDVLWMQVECGGGGGGFAWPVDFMLKNTSWYVTCY